ncbi:MAG: hypothetical protein Q9157_003497 [Trypethelium eluteriae]
MSFKTLINRIKVVGQSGPKDGFTTAPEGKLFSKTDPTVDGEECLHDCDSCTVKLPSKFKIEEDSKLYGYVAGWQTHLLVATGKTDWLRDVEHEKGSIMEAIDKCKVEPSNGKLKLSASNIPIPSGADSTTTCLLLPAFTFIDNVDPSSATSLIESHINTGPTNTTPLIHQPTSHANGQPNGSTAAVATSSSTLSSRPCPHRYLILLCSHKTRDARCGQSAPLLRKEFERHLRPLGLYRDLDDERPGGVGIYFISHVGGHKFSANVMIYRRADAAGVLKGEAAAAGGKEVEEEAGNMEAAQCIWLARVRPEDCENVVRYTVLQGKVVKPESQLRGGFDRGRQLVSW